MLSSIFVKKTLMDVGGFELEEPLRNGPPLDLFDSSEKRFFYIQNPTIGGYIVFHYPYLIVGFDSPFLSHNILAKCHLPYKTEGFFCRDENDFEALMRTARSLIQGSPCEEYEINLEQFDPSNLELEQTEKERVRLERQGQDLYRKGLEDLWGNRCAVTGIGVKEVLRASHALAWKDCRTGKQRLDRYNGFLLTANLDALFDKYLITFDDHGNMEVSPLISKEERRLLGIGGPMRLRFICDEHKPYLRHHQTLFNERNK